MADSVKFVSKSNPTRRSLAGNLLAREARICPPLLNNCSILLRLVPYLVGSLLVVAAVLKTWQLVEDPFAEPGLLTSRWFRAVLAEMELVCGLALLLGFLPRLARWAGLGLFAIFLVVSIFHVGFGAASCGCLGNVELAPWSAVLLDLAALVGLWYWQPGRGVENQRRLALVIAAVLPIIPVWVFLTDANGFPRVEVEPPLEDLGTLHQGERRNVRVRLYNPHEETVNVAQLEFSCPCLGSSAPACILPPLEEAFLRLELDLGKKVDFTGNMLVEVRGRTSSGETAFVARLRLQVVPSERVAVRAHRGRM